MPLHWAKPIHIQYMPETSSLQALQHSKLSKTWWHTHISPVTSMRFIQMSERQETNVQICFKQNHKQTLRSQHLNGRTVLLFEVGANITLSILCLRLPKSNGLTFTEDSRSFSLPKRVERVCDLGVILLYKGISLHPPLAHRQITQWLYATQYCMTTSSAWGVYHHVSFIWLEWSLIWSIGKLKIYVKFITEQMSSWICFSRRNKIPKISLDCLKNLNMFRS